MKRVWLAVVGMLVALGIAGATPTCVVQPIAMTDSMLAGCGGLSFSNADLIDPGGLQGGIKALILERWNNWVPFGAEGKRDEEWWQTHWPGNLFFTVDSWKGDWMQSRTRRSQVAEPVTAGTIGFGLLLLGWVYRRVRRR